MTQEYIRDGIYSIDEVFHLLRSSADRNITVNGHLVNRESARYACFKYEGTACCKCGLQGEFFALERQPINTPPNRYHFNLYAHDADGNEVMICKHKTTTGSEPICEKCLEEMRNQHEKRD